MKILSAIIFVALLVSCSHIRPYHSVSTGPKARIQFSSPELLPDVSDVDVMPVLIVLESNDDCSYDGLGGIRLSFGSHPDHKEIPAGEPAYFRLWRPDSEQTAFADNRLNGFSFVPEAGKNYLIEALPDKEGLKIQYYTLDENGIRTRLDVRPMALCN